MQHQGYYNGDLADPGAEPLGLGLTCDQSFTLFALFILLRSQLRRFHHLL
jgi:hypothetical protein